MTPEDQARKIAYIIAELVHLEAMAAAAGLDLTAYLISVARLEAERAVERSD